MEISRNVVIDVTTNDVLNYLSALQRDRGLSSTDMEIVSTKVLAEIRAVKNYDYARQIVNLSQRMQILEKEAADDNSEHKSESDS